MNDEAKRRLEVLLDGWNTLRRAHLKLESQLHTDLHLRRKVTPDGHTVGSVGDCVAVVAFGLTLDDVMNSPSRDALTRDHSEDVEIKTTQRTSWAFRNPGRHKQPTFMVLLAVDEDGDWQACWHGDAGTIYEKLHERGSNWSGQRQISKSGLAKLDQSARWTLPFASDGVAQMMTPSDQRRR